MDNTQGIPWSFTIEFDAEKAERNGYDLETLYDYVGRNVEKRFGLTRIGHGAWKVENKDNAMAQCAALSALARMKWVMQNVRSWVAYEDDEPYGHDYLQVIREVSPQLLCS